MGLFSQVSPIYCKSLQLMGLSWEKQKQQLLTDKNGVGVWPITSTGMWAESSSMSKSECGKLLKM